MKKAQVNQIFVYVLGLIIIGGIIILGYKMVFSVKKTESATQIEALRSALQKDVNGITSEYDNKRTFTKAISQKYTLVCFADTTPEGRSAIAADTNANPIVQDSATTGSNYSVFLIDGQIAAFRIKDLRVSPPNYSVCYNNPGVINYTLQGKGEYALLIP